MKQTELNPEDAAAIGEAFMEALPEDSQWGESPVECFVQLQNRLHDLRIERDNLYRACDFYAKHSHYQLDDWEAPDEPNWLGPPLEIEGEEPQRGPWHPDNPPPKKLTVAISPCWLVEDGGIARFALEGGNVPDLDDENADCEMLKLHEGAKPLAPPAVESAEGAKE